ncbi:hypothetical protein E8E13_004594 [Curvularia kusanoi]|uniref:Uncharacterized protein n=1 Tax=Curvularia kusanoi TaxID=90978 RepID=A0A9P4TGC1_CURKU|nr:hypothetical protein E8E13_004594 [Curvularia kusanoi]
MHAVLQALMRPDYDMTKEERMQAIWLDVGHAGDDNNAPRRRSITTSHLVSLLQYSKNVVGLHRMFQRDAAVVTDYKAMCTHTFGASCDIICKLVVWPEITRDAEAVFSPNVEHRDAAQRLPTHRKAANDKIRQLHIDLGHDHVAQWGAKDNMPVLKKTRSVLAKRAIIAGQALE